MNMPPVISINKINRVRVRSQSTVQNQTKRQNNRMLSSHLYKRKTQKQLTINGADRILLIRGK